MTDPPLTLAGHHRPRVRCAPRARLTRGCCEGARLDPKTCRQAGLRTRLAHASTGGGRTTAVDSSPRWVARVDADVRQPPMPAATCIRAEGSAAAREG